jgi:iron complex outermembrane recepter protein
MRVCDRALCSASVLVFMAMAQASAAQTAPAQAAQAPAPSAAAAPAAAGATSVGEVIVTAQKRQEDIQSVAMSIQAATGAKLTKLGITDTASLQKIVPGFLFTPTYYGTQVFTIRGVGFQDTSLAGSPTVTVYQDEAPLPFSVLTNGATLDLERVEVLKGPQGTLFGENATGGAINYIANKPTDHFEGGGDLSYGRFNDIKFDAFVSGPITDTLDGRIAFQTHNSDSWQRGYGPQAGQSPGGGADFLNGRISLQWKPNSDFKALLTVSGWQDKSYTQDGQLFGIAELSPLAPLAPAILNYPKAPHNDQAAGFMSCVNTSPYDPIAGQAGGSLWAVNNGQFESMGPGSIVQAGGQPTHCTPARNNNTFFSAQLRMDYSLPDDMTLTSLTSVEQFNRSAGIDGGGLPIQDYQSYQRGHISTVYQEFRLAGKFDGKGDWIFGVNYEHDATWDSFLQTYNASTASPTLFFFLPSALPILANPGGAAAINQPQNGVIAFALGPTRPTDRQDTDTYAAYANADYPILDNLIFHAGIRFTQENKTGAVCGLDGGDGSWALVAEALQAAEGSTHPVLSPAGTCASTGPASANFNSPAGGGLFVGYLDQNNVSWRTGLDWKVDKDILLYFNVSKGWKGGSFPTVALSTFTQSHPVTQESLQAYEVGFKSSWLDHQLTADGAFFYYDYTNKQILGAVSDQLFGALPSLVNVPQSHVEGFELSGAWAPDMIKGLTVTPAVSYQFSQVDSSSKNTCAPPPAQLIPGVPGLVNCIPGHYYGFDAFNEYADFTHESFPDAPRWQVSVDAEYDWKFRDDITAYIGANLSYTSDTHTFFYNRSPTPAFSSSTGTSVPNFVCFVDATGACTPGPVGPSPTNHPNDPLAIPGYTLIDLRAGIIKGDWQFQVWGRNVGNTYYWTAADHVNDVLLRYTGMPATYGVTFTYRYH